ncbi:MAG TPA: gamma-glutamyl-gamma-aminobutyrate hydrolase family protein [Bacillota bacterium]|nr:gamma-glutamyl-gamma-aminobutyrate hydrolase family protein [Bacillota bacterium]
MRPWIGMTISKEGTVLKVEKDNIEAITQSGGIPVVIPYVEKVHLVKEYASKLDGLMLTGGGDIDPLLYAEEPIPALGYVDPERDFLEKKLVEEILKKNKPLLGICRGCQILNVAAGGDLYQDLSSQIRGELIQHKQNAPRDHLSHTIKIFDGSLLKTILSKDRMKVNSFHHQAVRQLAPGFEVAAVSLDGVIEAFYSKEHRFVLGIQWHPENLIHKYEHARKLFAAFVKACEERRSQ